MIETGDVPAHIMKIAQDPDLFITYAEASEMYGTGDIVVCFSPSEPDDIYAGPRENIVAGLLEEQADNPLTPGVLENLKRPASLATGSRNSYWLLVSEDGAGVHCVAVVATSKSSMNS